MVLVKFLQLLADQRLRNGNKIASKPIGSLGTKFEYPPDGFFANSRGWIDAEQDFYFIMQP
jgi:hypothetical protein